MYGVVAITGTVILHNDIDKEAVDVAVKTPGAVSAVFNSLGDAIGVDNQGHRDGQRAGELVGLCRRAERRKRMRDCRRVGGLHTLVDQAERRKKPVGLTTGGDPLANGVGSV